MQRLLILLVSITVLSGCAYRDPISISQTMPEEDPAYIKKTALNTVIDMGWDICEKTPNKFDVYRSYKRWAIHGDLTLNGDSYTLAPNLEMTTLSKNNGSVHKKVNAMIRELDSSIQYRINTYKRVDQELPNISSCKGYWIPLKRDYKGPLSLGFKSASAYVDKEYAWVIDSFKLPKNTVFNVKTFTDNTISPTIAESMQKRMEEEMLERNLYTESSEYILEVNLYGWHERTLGTAIDSLGYTKANQQLSAIVFLKKGDDALAKIRVQAHAPTSNIVGAIYKASKLITDVAAMGILDTLQEKMIEE